jgi:hypothetical protein
VDLLRAFPPMKMFKARNGVIHMYLAKAKAKQTKNNQTNN